MKLLAVLSTTTLLGCVVTDDDLVGEVSQDVASTNRLSMNRLSMNRLSMNRLSMNRLSMNRLSMNRLSMNRLSMNELADTEDGREVFAYTIRCALPAGLELDVVDDAGTVLWTFPGAIGLAPEWESAPLSESGQRWISACLLAHVNAYGISVPISLRGPHPALTIGGTEAAAFPIQEAAFYGNLFTDTAQLYGCTGEYYPTADGNPYLQLRVCGSTTTCGFEIVGDCARRKTTITWACESTALTYYQACHSSGVQTLDGKSAFPATSTRYDEVITVYLMSTDAFGEIGRSTALQTAGGK